MTTVVGYDGSDGSREAVGYALKRGGTVVVVHAFGPPPDWLGHPGYDRMLEEHEARGRQLLEELWAEIEPKAEAELVQELIAGRPAEALANVARVRDADEIVVGSRGFGRLRAALGSVSHQLLHEADRPVVVLPAGQTD